MVRWHFAMHFVRLFYVGNTDDRDTKMSEKMTSCSRKFSFSALIDFFFFILTVNFTIIESCKIIFFFICFQDK